MVNRETVTRSSRIVFGEDGIVRITVHPGTEMSLADAQENLRLVSSAFDGRPVPVLVDISKIRSLAPEARRHFEGPESTRVHRALALLVGSPVARVIGNFFLSAVRGRVPTRLFTAEADAIAWLTEHRA